MLPSLLVNAFCVEIELESPFEKIDNNHEPYQWPKQLPKIDRLDRYTIIFEPIVHIGNGHWKLAFEDREK